MELIGPMNSQESSHTVAEICRRYVRPIMPYVSFDNPMDYCARISTSDRVSIKPDAVLFIRDECIARHP